MLLKYCCTVKNDAIHGCLSCGHISNCRVVGIMQMEYKVGCVEVKFFCVSSMLLYKHNFTNYSVFVKSSKIRDLYILPPFQTCNVHSYVCILNDVLIYTPQDLRIHLIPVHVYSYPTCIVHLF